MSILFTFLRFSHIDITYVMPKFHLLHMMSWWLFQGSFCVACSRISVYVKLGERSTIIRNILVVGLEMLMIWWRTFFQINCEVLNFRRAVTISTFGGRRNFLPKTIFCDSLRQTYASCCTCRRLYLQILRLSYIFSSCKLKVVIPG